MTRSTRRRILVPLFVCSPCLWCWGCFAWLERPHDRFLRLLRGDPGIRVTRLTGRAGQRPFDALRSADPDGYVPRRRDGSDRTGPTVHVDVWTDALGSYPSSFELTNDERVSGMTVFCELDDHYYFWVPLPQPIPAPLAVVFAEEREWDRDNRPRR